MEDVCDDKEEVLGIITNGEQDSLDNRSSVKDVVDIKARVLRGWCDY